MNREKHNTWRRVIGAGNMTVPVTLGCPYAMSVVGKPKDLVGESKDTVCKSKDSVG